VGPRAPEGPAGPAGPVGPLTFHESAFSLWRHRIGVETTRSWPFGLFAHALITDDAATSCRDAAAATSVPPPIAAAATPAASSRILVRLKLRLTPSPSVAGRCRGTGTAASRKGVVRLLFRFLYGLVTVSAKVPAPRTRATRTR
jgi:hypothetical protein